jgi:hypothetical protein
VVCRGCSEPLQRAIVDFGADAPAARIPQKLKEHYGIEVCASTCWSIVLQHARTIDERPKAAALIPERDGVEQLIGEIDGSMIPVVETAEANDAKADRRKTRQVGWKEARLTLVHALGSVTPVFGATVGPPAQVGETLVRAAVQAGLGRNTKVHVVSDGASWIADQVSEQFGLQGHFLVDFYHVCEYLTAAGKTIAGTAPRAWLETQKDRLKQNRLQDVIEELKRFVEDDTVADDNAPVRAAHRYLTNRPGQFNYQDALAAKLPIESGQIESAHRYVIQDRLKRAGAWWKLKNAKHMLALRVCRANQEWDSYWQSRGQQAA